MNAFTSKPYIRTSLSVQLTCFKVKYVNFTTICGGGSGDSCQFKQIFSNYRILQCTNSFIVNFRSSDNLPICTKDVFFYWSVLCLTIYLRNLILFNKLKTTVCLTWLFIEKTSLWWSIGLSLCKCLELLLYQSSDSSWLNLKWIETKKSEEIGSLVEFVE